MPAVASGEEVKCPESGIVGLCADDAFCPEEACQITGELVGSTHVPREDGDDEVPRTIYIDHGRIGVLVPNEWSDAPDTDTHSADEDPPFEGGEVFRYERLDMIDVLDPFSRVSGEETSIRIAREDRLSRLDPLG